MAPLPDNTTARLYVDYAGDFGTRTMQFRSAPTTDQASHIANVEAFVENVIAPFWFQDVAVTGARYSAANSNISLPVPFAPIQGQVVSEQNPVDYPEFLAFQGRGRTQGRKVRLSVYGVSMSVTNNYRLVDGEGPFVLPLITALKALVLQGSFSVIDGDAPVIYDYLNAGYNAYHQRKARRTG